MKLNITTSKLCLSISTCILNTPQILTLIITLHPCQQLSVGSWTKGMLVCGFCVSEQTVCAIPKFLTNQKSQTAALRLDASE